MTDFSDPLALRDQAIAFALGLHANDEWPPSVEVLVNNADAIARFIATGDVPDIPDGQS